MLEITENNLKEVTDNNDLVLLDFYAQWCTPCKCLNPILEQLDSEYKDTLVIAKVDIDKNEELTKQYNLRGVPTLILFKAGKQLQPKVGVLSKSDLEEYIENSK